jgi:cytosolic 5'-nucleotidase 3
MKTASVKKIAVMSASVNENNKMDNLLIVSSKNLERIRENISRAGVSKFHVVADFDRTLTKPFVNGQKAPTVIAQIRNGDYLTPDYSPEAHKLYDIYHPIEINPNLAERVKKSKMNEWWEKHFELLYKCGVNKGVLQKIVSKRTLEFRAGALEFIDNLHDRNIPLVIISAGPGDMIKMYLEQEGRLYTNVYVIANFFRFDKTGKAIGLTGKMIHSLNKDETNLKGTEVYERVRKRKNILLLGDNEEDVDMVKGFKYENLIKVGYLNEDTEKHIEGFKERYDVVLFADSDLEYPSSLVKYMFP